MFKGAITAIVTPFSNGEVDWKSFENLVKFQIKNGIDGIVPCGTTGESATLSYDEHNKVVEMTVKIVSKKVPVIAGTGANSTEEAIELTEHAKKVGADASLQVTPYYNKPTQEGLYRHFKKIAEGVDIPIILYNVPGRTGVNLLPETVVRLSKIPNIVGIKEASGNINQVTEICKEVKKKNFSVLSGDDALTLPILAVGGKGVISVASNIIPAKVSKLVALYLMGETEKAVKLHYELYTLMQTLFIETNPIPVKTALYLMGMIKNEFRLPLCEMSENNVSKLKKILSDYKLIK
ncbi:MAG: 4-hydroxy-tetrahydrodipicolinate synthase [bacterium]